MKKGKQKKRVRSHGQEAFVRGFVATALLASVDRTAGAGGGLPRNGLQRAFKGGIAVACGTLAAEALRERMFSKSLLAVVAGAACMMILDRYPTPDKAAQGDEGSGQEKEIGQVQT